MAIARRRDREDIVLAGDDDDAHALIVAQFVEGLAHLGGPLGAARACLFAQVLFEPLEFDGGDLSVADDIEKQIVRHAVRLL